MVLEDETDRAIAQARELVGAPAGECVALDGDRARIGGVEGPEAGEQGAFAAAGWPTQGQRFARGEGEAHPTKDLERPKPAGDAVDTYQWCAHDACSGSSVSWSAMKLGIGIGLRPAGSSSTQQIELMRPVATKRSPMVIW